MSAATTKVTDLLNREQIRQVLRPSDAQGFLSLSVTWGMIVGCFALVAAFPHVLTVLFALVILGGRQLALAILMHECAHRSLFRTKWLNDFFGAWFCAYPTWNHLSDYRSHHIRHHKFTNTDKDNDLGLVTPFPTTRASMIRKVLRDLSGIAGLKRIAALLLMDFGFLTYTASFGAQKVDLKDRGAGYVLKTGVRRVGPVLLTNAALFGILYVMGQPMLYLLWAGAYLTTYSLFLRIRAIAEHACTELDPDPLKNTRTTYANLLDRLTVAPHHVNYHLEHHLLPTVPHYRLKKMHTMLREAGALKESHVAKNYKQVLQTVTTPVATQ